MMSPPRASACSTWRTAIITLGHDILAGDRTAGRKLVAVHHVSAGFQFPAGGRPGAHDFERYKRKLRRRFERSPEVVRVVGIIEPSFNVRGNAVVCQLGFHGVAAIQKPDMASALATATYVFRVKKNPDLGVHRPLQVNALDKAKGGLRGSLGYAAKSMEEGGVTRRSSYRDKQGHWNTRKFSLRASEQRDLDLIFEAVPPATQFVLYGIRRVRGHLLPLTNE